MGFFDNIKKNDSGDTSDNDKKENISQVLTSSIGPKLYAIECKKATLYVHEKAVIIDKEKKGFYKVIPLKSIVAIKVNFKDKSSFSYEGWNIEIETSFFNTVTSSGAFIAMDENRLILNDPKKQVEQVNEVVGYILKHIV